MTKDQQIRKAREVLALQPRQRPECEYDIQVALYRVERRGHHRAIFPGGGVEEG